MQTGHIDGMYAKFIEQFEGDLKYALECAGIFHSRTFYNFVNSLLYFPIVFVHIIGLREKLLEGIPMKLLGKDESNCFEDALSIPLAGPR